MLRKSLFRVMALLVSFVFVCSFAACDGNSNSGNSGNNGGSTTPTPPEGWAEEFLIYVNGSDDWTPFPGKSGVTFSNSDNGVLNVTNNGIKVEFVGKVVGESVITATHENTEKKALVKVRAMENNPATEKINYHYDPPRTISYELSAPTTGITLEAYYDGCYVRRYILSGDTTWIAALSTGKRYYKSGDRWFENEDASSTDTIARINSFLEDPPLLKVFYDTISVLGEGKVDPNNYYKGKERFLNIDCWVFDIPRSQNISGRWGKFWVNPRNGHTLKMVDTDGDIWETLSYNPDFTSWPNGWRP